MPEPAEPAAAPPLSVVVERSGGFAGLTRRWAVTPPAEEAATWWSLLDACAWDGASDDAAPTRGSRESSPTPGPSPGADRFSWIVSAASPSETRRATLAESQVDDAWRRLIDAVRHAAAEASADADAATRASSASDASPSPRAPLEGGPGSPAEQ